MPDIQIRASQVALVVKNPPVNVEDARDTGLIPELVRSPGVGNGTPLHVDCIHFSKVSLSLHFSYRCFRLWCVFYYMV